IGEIHVESPLEIDRISAICRRLAICGHIAVRVNPREEAQGGSMRMGGKPLQFGIDEEKLEEVISQIIADPCLDLQGLHLFTGTQILDHSVLLRQYRKGVEIAAKVARQFGHPLPTLDFGGGLGIQYFAGERPLNMEMLRRELNSLIADLREYPLFAGTQFLLEPGRYLVGEAGIYVCRVTDIKSSRGKKFLIVDGGMHHHLAASGNLGQVIKKNFPVAILNKMKRERLERVEVVGPLCTPLDVLARDIELPAADVGDLVGVFQSGAYARTSSPLGFLSHPSPAEVLVENGQTRLIRRRGTCADLFADLPAELS
ncbi:MAG: type III PLP-dependent enzyme, partial [Candidatus Binatia bacterium]